jgi:hypothetical protein
MYEMEGPRRPRRTRATSHLALLALRATRQGQAPARAIGFPISPASRSFLRVVPVSGGRSILTPSAGMAQEFLTQIFLLFSYPHAIHRYSSSFPQVAAVIHGLLTACPQITAGSSRNTKWHFADRNQPVFNGDLMPQDPPCRSSWGQHRWNIAVAIAAPMEHCCRCGRSLGGAAAGLWGGRGLGWLRDYPPVGRCTATGGRYTSPTCVG